MEKSPDREAVTAELAHLFESGSTLINKDIGELIPKHGYSENTAADIINNVRVVKALEERGIKLDKVKYRRHDIYYDARLPLEETDLEETKARIDQIEADRLEKIQKATQKNKLGHIARLGRMSRE